MYGIGTYELLMIVAILAIYALPVWPCWRICSKAGFPGPISLIALIPGGIIALLIALAILEWPVSKNRGIGAGL
jgi:hypothetical protein